MACASLKSFLASSPTTLSSRILGYFPKSCQVWKNGVQSMYGITSATAISCTCLLPMNFGVGTVVLSKTNFGLFCCANSKGTKALRSRCFAYPSLTFSSEVFSCNTYVGPSAESSLELTPTARLASLTCITAPLYSGSIFTAVCALEVVAPPMSNGMCMFMRSISLAIWIISSRDGVINPLSPKMSTWCS